MDHYRIGQIQQLAADVGFSGSDEWTALTCQLWQTAVGIMYTATIHDYFYQVPDSVAYNQGTKDCGENLADSENGSPNLS